VGGKIYDDLKKGCGCIIGLAIVGFIVIALAGPDEIKRCWNGFCKGARTPAQTPASSSSSSGSSRTAKDYYDEGDSLWKERSYAEAVKKFTRAIEINGNYEDGKAYYMRGLCYRALKNNCTDAENDFLKYLEFPLDSMGKATAYYCLGSVNEEWGYKSAARIYYQKSIDADPVWKDEANEGLERLK